MSATNRVEKYKGVTLMVDQGWLTVVSDATGFQVAGPVESDPEVVSVARQAVPFLQALEKSNG